MNVKYEHKPEMTFIGFSTTIHSNEGYVKCPEFWDKEYVQKYAHLWQTMRPETPLEKAVFENEIGMFAICDDKNGTFDYWIAGLYKGGDVPKGLKLYIFPESDWAVFSAKGPLPDSLQKLNTMVWQKWYPNEGRLYNGNGNAMLEVYSAGNMQGPDYECGIWVPIGKLQQNEEDSAETAATSTLLGIL